MTKIDVANSNIIALCATLLVRLIAGPCCDRFGPRWTFAGCLVIGAIPTFLAGTCYTKNQLFACRFFVGILGGAFVPCQVWSTGFFDKNIVGTSNAIIAGFGNAGGGVTYFLMPTIYDSLVADQGYSPHVAWRITFIVPGVIILTVAAGLFGLCQDTPTGKWADRHMAAQQNLESHGVHATIVDAPGAVMDKKTSHDSGSATPPDVEKATERKLSSSAGKEAVVSEQAMIDTALGEVVAKPTALTILKVMFRPQVLVLAFWYVLKFLSSHKSKLTFCSYFNSFGAELAINSTLSTYYQKNFTELGQTQSGQWAAMFGLLNVVTRPLGGIIADILYKRFPNVWIKKAWIHFLGIVTGAFLIAIGLIDPMNQSTMFGLIAGMAIFLEAGNGANFALVPHVEPQANGIVSGMTGATGNLGGIVFAIIFRYMKRDYAKSFWITGVIGLAMNVVFIPIPPVSKRQIGGR